MNVVSLVLFVSFLCSAWSANPSYNDLATQYVPSLYTTSVNLLPSMNSSTMPTDVKTLRKALLYCRDMLDIFAYAYPNNTEIGSKTMDIWVDIRGDFNDGYTIIGNFQDLAHSGVNYNKKQLKERRNDCLDWKSSFVKNIQKYDYELFVNKVSSSQLFYRDPSELSAFYWEYVNVYPKSSLSGIENIAALERGLLNLADKNYTIMTGLTAPYEDAQHTLFHDYRKLLRSITSTSEYFAVFKQNTCVDSTIQTLNTMYDNLGNINDEVVAYEYYVQNDEKSKADAEKQQVMQDWNSFLQWAGSAFNQQYQFQCLLQNLI